MDRQLKVVVWNANGVGTRRNELHFFVSDLDADVILISETHLQPTSNFSLPAYHTYRTDRRRRPQCRRNPGGGTAVLVHRRLTHRAVDLPDVSIESTGVVIYADGTEILLVSAYIPPRVAFQPHDMDALLATPGPVIVAGDLNAKHPSWNSRTTNTKGRALRRYLDQRVDTGVAAPDEPTHYPPTLNGVPDVLDIVLFKGLPFPVDVRSVIDLSSDHMPVLLSIATCPTSRNPPQASAVRTDWALYNSMLSTQLAPPVPATSTAELDEQVASLHAELSGAVAASSTPAPRRQTRSSLPPHIRAELAKRRQLRQAWQRSRNPATKRQFNQQCALVKMILDDFRTETWDSYLASLDIDDGSAWKAAKLLRGTKSTSHPLHCRRGLAYTASDKAEAFADTMEEQFQPHADIFDEDHGERIESHTETFFTVPPDEEIVPFTLQEISNAVAKAKPRKAPGQDKIGAKALQAAPPSLLQYLFVVFNSALRLHHFPATWKSAKIILLPKPGKSPLYPQNFRPISLLPSISKLFEKLLLSRLSPLLDPFIRPEQFGFRRGHSTTHQLVRVVSKLVDAANVNMASVAVLLDVSKAFDRVWHEGLLFKLSESPIPSAAVHLLRSYLTARSFRTFVEGELSTTRSIRAGVPQGSVLGPILYLVYTNDLPTVPGVTLSLYADDAMLHCSSFLPARAADVMQQQMNALSPWLQKWRIAINTDKSDAIIFRKFRRMPRARPPPVTLEGEPISWKTSVKYLGVTLDAGLNFGQHVRNKVTEARRIQGLIQPLLQERSPLPLRVKTTIFLMIVRSIIMYASTAWWALASKTNKKTLEACQSKALRRITRQPWFVRNAAIRESLRVPSLDEFARSTAVNLFQKAALSDHPHIEVISRRNGPPGRRRPRPIAILDDPP